MRPRSRSSSRCCRWRRWPTSWATATSIASGWCCSRWPRSAARFAPSLPWLLAARTFQGLGGAAIMSVQPALVRAIYPRNMLGRGLGFNTTVVATSLAAGPSIGAALLSITSWPILFAVYVPLGIISFVLAERYLPHTTHTHRPFDVLSAVLSGVTFGLLIFGIDGMAHGHRPAGDRRPSSSLRGRAGHAVRVAPEAARRSDDADRRLQAADLLALDHRRDLHLHRPGPRLRQPALLLPHRAGPRAPPTPASC